MHEAYLDIALRANEYLANPTMPAFLWLRYLMAQRLMIVHRRHLGAQARDAGREISKHRGAIPQATSVSLAHQLLGRLTSASQAAMRAELQTRLQVVLNGMEPLDREVLALRHFEELSNAETAQVLGIQKAAASNRDTRALRRLKELLEALPGGFEN